MKRLLISFLFISLLTTQIGASDNLINQKEKTSRSDNAEAAIAIPTELREGLFSEKVVNKYAYQLIWGLKKYIKRFIHNNALQEILFYILCDTALDDRVKTNIAVEFLADKNYSDLYTPLSKLINVQFAPIAYPLALELKYPKNVQPFLLPSISAAILDAEKIRFSNNPSLMDEEEGYDDTAKVRQIVEGLTQAGLSDTLEILHGLMNDHDYEAYVKHLFSTKPSNFDSNKMITLLKSINAAIRECRERKIDLNFENKEGITPLIWTTMLPKTWSDNGHSTDLQINLINAGAQIAYKNKNNQDFSDFAPEAAALYKKIIESGLKFPE